ncbi:MAG: hypothetical protein P1U40_00740 [Coxiellaceae bacterium]|nr:hypothetical protein [Coxiellaceae bacterium]
MHKKRRSVTNGQIKQALNTVKKATTDSTGLFKLSSVIDSRYSFDDRTPELYNHTASLLVGAAAVVGGCALSLFSIFNLAKPTATVSDLKNLGIGLFFTASGIRSMAYAHDVDVVEDTHLTTGTLGLSNLNGRRR